MGGGVGHVTTVGKVRDRGYRNSKEKNFSPVMNNRYSLNSFIGIVGLKLKQDSHESKSGTTQEQEQDFQTQKLYS